jgi:hypothetical protein
MNAKTKRGVRRMLHRNGVVAVEENFSGHKLHGRRRTWHRNGQLATEEFYRDGRLHGVVRQWNENGKLLGSFRMEHGTGTQKSWHDNGRLNLEFASRMWLRDGTLISDQILLFDRNVTPDQYRRAAARDPRLPKLRGRIGKPPVKNRALQKHIYRVFLSGLLSKRNRSEARTWLKAAGKKARALGRFKRANDAAKLVQELYQAGASQVMVPDIYRNQRGTQFADSLLVQLPRDTAGRKAVRAVCAQLPKRNPGAVEPDKDMGESHLYLLLA